MNKRNVVLTGAGGGIGRVTAQILGAAGYQLILTDKHYDETFDEFIDSLTKQNIPHLVLEIDVTNEEECTWLADEINKTFGDVYGIVNNAGIHKRTTFKELSQSQYDLTMDVNLKGAIFLTQQLLPRITDDGSIVFITSTRAYLGSDHGLDYVVSKSGMIGAVKALAVELAPKIRVNGVAPFSIKTPMLNTDDEQMRNKRIERTLLKRLGEPEDVAYAVEYLLSDKSNFVTGQILHVNGGAYLG